MPKVSVILTSFNHAKYICESIDSVLNQTFTDFELIILDDASTDNSWDLINKYSDSRIKAYVSSRPGEVDRQLNKAIFEMAMGDYIAIHHSDDVWRLDKLEQQVMLLDFTPELGAVFTWVQIIDENGAHLPGNWFDQINQLQWQWLNQLFLEQNHLNHPSVLIRKQCYQEVGGYRYGLAQTSDAEMWSRVLMSFPIHVIQEKLTKHRRFSDNSSASGDRLDVAIRANNEWNILRENFLSILDFEQIVAIFPNLERYRNSAGFDTKFLFAMACLHECNQGSAWQLGLKWLFDILGNEISSKKIRELYSFSYIDFIKLTGEFDAYAVEGTRRVVAEHAHAIVELQTRIQQLLTGNAWLSSQREAWEQTATERETSINAIQAQVQELIIGNSWLSSQREAWEQTAAERETSINALQAQVQELIIGNAWLSSQREAWEQTATERETFINALQAQVQELIIGNTWLSSQREAWEKIAAERDASIIALNSTLNDTMKGLATSEATLQSICNHRGMRFINFLLRKKLF